MAPAVVMARLSGRAHARPRSRSTLDCRLCGGRRWFVRHPDTYRCKESRAVACWKCVGGSPVPDIPVAGVHVDISLLVGMGAKHIVTADGLRRVLP